MKKKLCFLALLLFAGINVCARYEKYYCDRCGVEIKDVYKGREEDE